MLHNVRKVAVSILVLALVLLVVGPAQADFEEEVGGVINRFLEAWNAGDAEKIANMFTKEADLWSRTGVWYTGRSEIAGYFSEWISAAADDAKDIHLEAARLVNEQIALVDVISSLTPERGTPQRTTVTVVVERQIDGSWLFAGWRECPAR